MKILITGATGIIGRKLITKLKHFKSYQIKILIRANKENIAKDNNIELIRGDLLNPDSLDRAARGIDIAVHLAGITHTNQQDLYYQVNTVGTENLLRASQDNKVKKLIYISSRAASWDGGAYARSKLLAEKKVQQYQMNWIILSLSEVYGAGGSEAISRLINLIKKSYFIPIIDKGQYFLCPVFIDDIIDGIIQAIQKNNIFRKKYILAGPEEFTYDEIINLLLKILGLKRIKVNLPLFFIKFLYFIFYIFKKDIFVRDQLPRLLCKKSSDITLAKKDLNFHPRNFEAGIKEMLNH